MTPTERTMAHGLQDLDTARSLIEHLTKRLESMTVAAAMKDVDITWLRRRIVELQDDNQALRAAVRQ